MSPRSATPVLPTLVGTTLTTAALGLALFLGLDALSAARSGPVTRAVPWIAPHAPAALRLGLLVPALVLLPLPWILRRRALRRREGSLGAIFAAGPGWVVSSLGSLLGIALVLALPLVLAPDGPLPEQAPEADGIVVLGARVHADGSPSLALEDRLRTAAELWRAGRAPRVLVSGGPGDGDVHETTAMARGLADLGVDPTAVDVDLVGHSTRATARHAAHWLREREGRRLLVVSQDWHLPRAVLALRREGVEAVPVPCTETRPLTRRAWFQTRELAAFWAYWLRDLVPGPPPVDGP